MLKPYFLTTKSNLMTKFELNGKSIVMALSVFAFMILGSVNATAQYVNVVEATTRAKMEISTLEADYENATTNEERSGIAFEIGFYTHLINNMTDLGMEVPAAIEAARPVTKPIVNASGWITYSTQISDTFKAESETLISNAQDLLSD